MDRAGHSLPGEYLHSTSLLDDNIPFEESIYDTTSKASDKVIPDAGESFLTPAFSREKQSIEAFSFEEEKILGILSSVSDPKPTENTDSPLPAGLYWASKLKVRQDKVSHKAKVHNEGLWQEDWVFTISIYFTLHPMQAGY